MEESGDKIQVEVGEDGIEPDYDSAELDRAIYRELYDNEALVRFDE